MEMWWRFTRWLNFQKRRSITGKDDLDKPKREYFNSFVTELDYHEARAKNWAWMKNKNGEYDFEKFKVMLQYEQSYSQRRNTRWFIILTIVNILVLITSNIL